ncbi:aminotransferase class III-fold pyridoxal phosphate-dependent enzyme, partial [Bacillus cereus]
MQATEQTQSLKQADEKYLWHAMKGASPNPTNLIITKAEGAWVTDIDGNRYLDGMSGLWCVNVGYGRKELARAAFEQLEEMPYFPLT